MINRTVCFARPCTAITTYAYHYSLTCSHEPLLRTILLYVQKRGKLAKKEEKLKLKLQQVQEEKRKCQETIEGQLELTNVAIQSQDGPEAYDYWLHSGALEALFFSECTDNQKYNAAAARLAIKALAPHQISTTIGRIEKIKNLFQQEASRHHLLPIFDEVVHFLTLTREDFEKKGQIILNKSSLQVDNIHMGTSMNETMRITSITDDTLQSKQKFYRRTFSMKGLVHSPRAYFIPG